MCVCLSDHECVTCPYLRVSIPVRECYLLYQIIVFESFYSDPTPEHEIVRIIKCLDIYHDQL